MDPQSLLKRAKKACTECRQQKHKCDAYLNPDQPCTRCRKSQIKCVISDPFRREHKRQRRAELEHEANELRRQLQAAQAPNHHASPIAMLTAAAEMGVHSASSEIALSLPTPPAPALPTPPASGPPSCAAALPVPSYAQQLLSSAGLGEPLAQVDIEPDNHRLEPTVPRTLNNVTVKAEEIDDLFQVFFREYSQFLPILDVGLTPNAYYTQSPFLFWAVIGVACRSYPKNPTLLTALSRGIVEMALLSALSTTPWHTVQGLLLLLTWPFAKDKTRSDVTFTLSGMMLHIAMQNGTHIPMSSHEFSRFKTPAPTEADMVRRSELWAHCVIAYQNSCIVKGQLARTLNDMHQELGQSHRLFQRIAPGLVLKLKCLDLVTRCSAAVVENGVRNLSLEQERSLDIILRTYESQITDLETQFTSAVDRFHVALCRLSIQVFHFYKTGTLASTGALPRLLAAACRVIDFVQSLGQTPGRLVTIPVQINFGLLLASVSLLRILKLYTSCDLDLERARASFFSGINLAKEMSVQQNDSAAKAVFILNQLWNSTKAYRKPDGSAYTSLRVRGRLVLSPVLDAVWWWRDENEPQYRTMYLPQGEAADGIIPPIPETHPAQADDPMISGAESTRNPSSAAASTMVNSAERQDSARADDHFLGDFEWALCEDEFFLSTGPYT
ncbi:Regulatory protein LEU3 [Aspergillus lentulus]|uniref:Regulatory protein LEU3 n=1 Tax=Aspergillus lentulus TaxID=293939 RepID=A0ABQ0ZWQ5_ASPLE|nr:Regulatory protein LEU3 [Aspergillus lentulus]GFF28779.1 Regulatory protein LEU3 [Aspergillus lentulus]GFF67290.1 Regulatory protein LEU3 [Aspergillus lentulus]GFG18139.1 Regulatory protein LEU3 [Aspergillus lentulus]